MIPIAAGLAALNLVTFILFGLDKRRAVLGKWRVPERTLLTLCALFGAAGGLAGMKLFRHKTRKPRFRFGVPALLAAQLVLALLAYLHLNGAML